MNRDNRAEITTSTIIIATLVMVLLISLTVIGMADMIDTYNANSEDAQIAKYDNYTRDITQTVDDTVNQNLNDNLGTVAYFTTGTYAAFRVSLNVMKVVTSIFWEFARDFPLLALVIGTILTCITVILMFQLIRAVFRSVV